MIDKQNTSKTWVEEINDIEDPEICWQYWKVDCDMKKRLGLEGNVGVEDPLIKIEFTARGSGKKGGRWRRKES